MTCRAAALSDEQASQTTVDDGFIGAWLIETERLTSNTKASRVGPCAPFVYLARCAECFESQAKPSQACISHCGRSSFRPGTVGYNLSTLGRLTTAIVGSLCHRSSSAFACLRNALREFHLGITFRCGCAHRQQSSCGRTRPSSAARLHPRHAMPRHAMHPVLASAFCVTCLTSRFFFAPDSVCLHWQLRR